MATVVEDLMRGSGANFDSKSYSYQRAFHVSELVGDADQMLFEAGQATGIPAPNDVHPAHAGMFVKNIRPTLTGASSADVIVTYRTLPGGENKFEPDGENNAVMQMGGTLQQTTVQEDKDGNAILIPYTPAGGAEIIQPGEIAVLWPQLTLSWTLTYAGRPDALANRYLFHVNSVKFDKDPDDDAAPRQWLCTDFNSTSADNGLTWPTTITFQKNIIPPFVNWDQPAWFIDDATGRLPTDPAPTEGNGLNRVKVYPERDFNLLNLP